MNEGQTSLFPAPEAAASGGFHGEDGSNRDQWGRRRYSRPKPAPTAGQGSHVNSRRAYQDMVSHLHERAQLIYLEIEIRGPGTDREIMDRLKFTDMNMVRPRITELIKKKKLLKEVGARLCPVTGKWVRVVDISERA